MVWKAGISGEPEYPVFVAERVNPVPTSHNILNINCLQGLDTPFPPVQFPISNEIR